MEIQEWGLRKPKMNRLIISGGMLAGKTTLASKFADDPTRVIFVSTDGNALNQGFRGIKFDFPNNFDQMMSRINEVFTLLNRARDTFDVIVWDLIEDFDETSQTLLRSDLENEKKSRKAWGKISGMYRDLQTLLRNNFEDKTVILLSRENRLETTDRWGKVVKVEYQSVLRDPLKNNVLKDVDASIRVYIDGDNKHQVEVSSVRYPETAKKIGEIIKKPIPEFKKQPTFQEWLDKTLAAAEKKASGVTGKEIKFIQSERDEMWKTNDKKKVNDYIKAWAENAIADAKSEGGAEGA